MAIKLNGKIVLNNFKETLNKKQWIDSIVWKSFYFLWPKALWFPMYIWYIIEDLWSKIFVWLLRRDTLEQRECTINKNIIKYDNKNDNKEERMYYFANIYGAKI
jgi:hypothetical protein